MNYIKERRYLVDIFEKLNEVNKNLQGDQINFIKISPLLVHLFQN